MSCLGACGDVVDAQLVPAKETWVLQGRPQQLLRSRARLFVPKVDSLEARPTLGL